MGLLSNLRKFGLGYCDLPTMLWNVTVMLRPLLLDVDSRNKKSIPFIFYILFPIVVASYFYVFFFSGFWFVLIRSTELGLTTYRLVVLSLVISTEMGPIKFFYLCLNRAATKKLIDGYLSCDALVKPGSRLARNIISNMRIVKKRAIAYWIVVIGNGIAYVIRPIFHPTTRTAIDEKYPLYGLEPVLESPNYELNIIAVSLAVTFTVYPPAHISALIIFLLGYTESQLLALGFELQEMWKDAEQYCEDIKNTPGASNEIDETVLKNTYVREKLKTIKNFHVMNVELIRQTERIFQNALAGQLLILIVSLITELLGGLEHTYIEIPFAFVQVAADCLAGQKLLDAGEVFDKAFYDSKWENFDVSNRKTVLLMLLNSQKTLNISAGGISVLNFELLMGITRSVYSAYTALRSKTM